MIIKGRIEDTDELLDILSLAIKHMDENGIPQWDEVYPNEKDISRDLQKGNLFIYKPDQITSGFIVLNEEFEPEYSEAKWTIHGEKILYVHRLCIHPSFQGKGISKELMKFAENYGRENNYDTIRLDAFTKNPAALGLYNGMNYNNAGIVIFPKGEFNCFEKKL